jgi:hypothetical protein
MTKLSLHDNHFDGSLPESWGNMAQIALLWLQNNYLDVTTIPRSWDRMKPASLKLTPQQRKVGV